MFDPNTLDCLFDGASAPKPPRRGDSGGDCSDALREIGAVAERRPKNRLPGFGGRGGGSSEFVLVLPVCCLCWLLAGASVEKALFSYFCRM